MGILDTLGLLNLRAIIKRMALISQRGPQFNDKGSNFNSDQRYNARNIPRVFHFETTWKRSFHAVLT